MSPHAMFLLFIDVQLLLKLLIIFVIRFFHIVYILELLPVAHSSQFCLYVYNEKGLP